MAAEVLTNEFFNLIIKSNVFDPLVLYIFKRITFEFFFFFKLNILMLGVIFCTQEFGPKSIKFTEHYNAIFFLTLLYRILQR